MFHTFTLTEAVRITQNLPVTTLLAMTGTILRMHYCDVRQRCQPHRQLVWHVFLVIYPVLC